MFIITVSGESVKPLLQAIHFRATPSPHWNNPGCFERMSRLVSTVQASVLSEDCPLHPEDCTPKEVQIPSPTILTTQELFYLSGHDT